MQLDWLAAIVWAVLSAKFVEIDSIWLRHSNAAHLLFAHNICQFVRYKFERHNAVGSSIDDNWRLANDDWYRANLVEIAFVIQIMANSFFVRRWVSRANGSDRSNCKIELLVTVGNIQVIISASVFGFDLAKERRTMAIEMMPMWIWILLAIRSFLQRIIKFFDHSSRKSSNCFGSDSQDKWTKSIIYCFSSRLPLLLLPKWSAV